MSLNHIVVYLILSLTITIGQLSTTETCVDFCHVENYCILQCSSENSPDNSPNDLWCDASCRKEHCIGGCHQWNRALNSSCYAACNSTDGHTRGQTLYCLRGCNLAISSYVDEIKARIGKITAPIPIAGSISNTSVTLEWKFDWNSTGLGWLHMSHAINVSIKWCHSQPEMCSTWEAVPNATGRSGQSLVTVNELRPYTNYRFRLVIVLASDREPLTSDESAPVLTLPSGLPSSPPINLQAVVLDANRISISWDPPHYPNGPLVSYSLNIQEASSRNAADSYQGSQDVVANSRSYTFVHLKPNTTYVVSVAACNSVAGGVGPFASRPVSTYPLEKLGNDLKPYFLIVVDNKSIYRHEPGLIDYTKSPIHESPTNAITGLAVHARQGSLFMADDDGYVYELSLKSKSDVRNRWHVGREIVHVVGLSVDWLFDRLYLLIENAEGTIWQISRCKLDGRESTYVVTDIAHKPSHFEVDPFNGFLVWAVNETDATGGLFIVDLAYLTDQPLSAAEGKIGLDSPIRHIVKNVAISAFKSDPINSRVFVMMNDVLTNRTIQAIPYSGCRTWPKIVRHSLRDAEDVSSMAYLDDVFYWINLGHSFFEEVDPKRDIHVHRFAPKAESSHTALVLCDIRSQPTPIPLTPVRNLEALFGSDSVYVRWDPPSTVSHRGRGAWQNWSYHIQIGDIERDISVAETDINTTEIKLNVLRPNTTYSIVVQPATDYDRIRYAPLRPISSDSGHVVSISSYFFGKTLASGEELRPIYWATSDGDIYQSNSVGEDVREFSGVNFLLPNREQKNRHGMKESVEVINMAWMYDSIYVVTNTNRVFNIDLPSRNITIMEGLEASSVATDWLSRKLYWSSTNRQTIGRCLADGSEPEWLPIIGRATSLAVHSTKGKLVWCTGHSVEGSFLNADERHIYWSSGLHSGNQALGMTIDYDKDQVYWLVKKLNGDSLLYRNNIDSSNSAPRINQIASASARGPLQYMSDRLIWLHELQDKIIISDLNGTNTYQLNSPKQLRVSWFLPAHLSLSQTFARLTVIPDSVDASSILLKPISDGDLVITWSPITNINYGNVSYDIRVSYKDDNCTAVTANGHFTVPLHWKVSPYSEISISIRAFTVWGSANISGVILRSPPSTPEIPLKPRAFVSFIRNGSSVLTEVVIHFRWSPPGKSNGELTGYRIHFCHDGTFSGDCQNLDVPAGATEFIATNLVIDNNYTFTVKAFTEIGYGPETRPLKVSTSVETPIPHLVIFTSNLLWLADLDNHASLNQSLAKRTISVPSPAVAVAFINHDRKIYWIDTQGDLYSHDLSSNDIKKIHHLNGTGQSLTIDWISRHAYWSQREMGVSSIYQLDLNKKSDEDTIPRLVLRDPRMVRLVEVDPFTSRLIWVSDNHNGTGTLMTTDIRGGQNRLFLNNPQYCGSGVNNNSVYTPPLALQTISTVDWSDTNNPRLLWTAHNDDIWSSDLKGCHSAPELSSSEVKRTGRWPISSLAVDRTHFYWIDVKERRIHKMRRSLSIIERTTGLAQSGSASAFTSRSEVLVELVNVYKVLTFGTNFQPLPNIECLVPSSLPYSVKLVSSTHNGLTLSMPVPLRPAKCNGMTMPPPLYHLYYGTYVSNQTDGCRHYLNKCLNETSSNGVVVLRKLLSNTKYVVHVSITNHYWPVKNSLPNIVLESAVIFSTQAGAPSKPREVTAMPTSPKSVRVQWLQPLSLNGINVTYSIHWLSENKFGPPIEGQTKVSEEGSKDQTGQLRYSTDINSLTADSVYAFTVNAYSTNGQSNKSDFATAKTFENPKPLLIKNITASSISLEWKSPSTLNILRHTLLWSILNQGNWKEIEQPVDTKADSLYHFDAFGLSPRTSYSFRLKLEYSPVKTYFFWPADEDGLSLTTKGNVPDQPLTPRAQKIVDNLVELWWGPTATNGYPILRYLLEMRNVEDGDFSSVRSKNETESGSSATHSNTQPAWKPIYNGSDHFYVVPNLISGIRYQFRVQAFNDMGASEVSESSSTFQMTSSNSSITMIVLVSALIAFCSVMFIFLFYVCKRTQFQGKKSSGTISHTNTGSEMTDLATLRELPRRESFIQQNNAIYGVGDGDVDQELALLPHIRFEDLLITKFLGRGAFGEVFEGTTCNLPGSNQYHTKVAVKTLRKGATDQEKGEFLKEAILMSQFKHKHILRLLAVCLDADPNFILLELMEGGDLLSFLRNNRPSLREPPANSATCCQLGLLDLVSMCVDVAKGCCYLEELHFVHRDLAARNCLVSSRDPRFRVVKIGDFGLARDIYRNDYYRKEGEGLLPVRWMAPESLVDGVFTCQTDVWSFGVLLWEILTLGQQPYPARTNLQVLHFVRTGGRLDRPPNCPDSLFELMMSCWSYEPFTRPTFTKCLAELLNLQDKLQHSPFTAVHNGHYVGGDRIYQTDQWETNRDSVGSSESCSYLDQHSLEQGPAIYTNDIAAVLHGLVSPNARQTIGVNNVLHRLERCSSVRNPRDRHNGPPISIVRSNSTTEGSTQSMASAHGRYLELLRDPVIYHSSHGCNGGYEVPRNIRYGSRQIFTDANELLPRSHSSNSQVDDDLSDVTDESCLANESVCASIPSPTNTIHSTFSVSTMPSEINHL